MLINGKTVKTHLHEAVVEMQPEEERGHSGVGSRRFDNGGLHDCLRVGAGVAVEPDTEGYHLRSTNTEGRSTSKCRNQNKKHEQRTHDCGLIFLYNFLNVVSLVVDRCKNGVTME